MAEHSTIEWTEATWNPITGCSVISPGCTNCYAMRLAGSRLKNHPSRAGLTDMTKTGPVWNGEIRFNEEWLRQPLEWSRARMIFVCAHADLFHENVPDAWIDEVFAVMALAQHHTFQVLTKRADRMRSYLTELYAGHRAIVSAADRIKPGCRPDLHRTFMGGPQRSTLLRPLPNVWLGVSVEDQKRAEERIPELLQTPAAIRWISAEPLLGPLDLEYPPGLFPNGPRLCCSGRDCWCMGGPIDPPLIHGLNWVVAGGESQKGSRPSHPEWFRDLRDQCVAAGVPFLFKQWGDWAASGPHNRDMLIGGDAKVEHPVLEIARVDRGDGKGGLTIMARVGKKAAGRLLDGRTWDEMPKGATYA